MPAIKKPDQGWDLERLYRDHGDKLCRYLYRMTGHYDVAQDLAQASFERMQMKYGGQPIAHPRALLFAMATNFALMRGRKESTRRRILGEHIDVDEADELGAPIIEAGPENEALRDQVRAGLLTAIERLSTSQREAMLMNDLEGGNDIKRRDMAGRLNISEKRLDKRITEAHRRCRESLIAQGIDVTALTWR